jgi:hypothetical protein
MIVTLICRTQTTYEQCASHKCWLVICYVTTPKISEGYFAARRLDSRQKKEKKERGERSRRENEGGM